MLSEELYSKPTHFVLELIQNADDNTYSPDVRPKLSLLYREDGYLWLGSNEVGFTAQNVESLCGIGDSTKKQIENAQKGYIGEKGVGFKSVFKVADVAWIKSGALSFSFDKSKFLGMLAPQWTEFFAHPQFNERTMFCFRILPEHQRTIQEHLLGLRPELLLFLRKLNCIQLKIQKTSTDVQNSISLSKREGSLRGVRLITLEQQTFRPKARSQTEVFLVFEHTVDGMPAEKKRDGVTKSTAVMAFPITSDEQPVICDRMSYNFLPIRSYGLPFVLQADFMLSANREDVLQGNAWNHALVSATTRLFLSSIDTFNSNGLLKYTWPQFTVSQGVSSGTIFRTFFPELLAYLRQQSVLESQASTFERPDTLEIVPFGFTDGGKPPIPLIYHADGRSRNLSASYAPDDVAALRIGQQTPEGFCALLRSYSSSQIDQFRVQTGEWHSMVADAVFRAGAGRVKDIKLIPLRDGTWISGRDPPFYFAEFTRDVTVPTGIHLAMIDGFAAEDESRRKLFSDLGARTIGVAQVYEQIVTQHGEYRPDLHSWIADDVISHARFLYSATSMPRYSDVSVVRVAVQGPKQLKRGDEVYMDVPGSKFRISDLFGTKGNDVLLLHDGYLTRTTEAWISWLQTKLGVRTFPKLVDWKSKTTSSEFRWLIENKPSSVWLTLLRDSWDHYYPELRPTTQQSFLANTLVGCTDGKGWALKEVYLPTTAIISEKLAAHLMPMLAVTDPDDPKWANLSTLLLTTRPNLRFYLTILSALPKKPTNAFTAADVLRIYTEIEKRLYGHTDVVKKTFAEADLVYVRPNKWVGLGQCRGRTLPCLPNLISLAENYRSLYTLFVETLGVKDADASDVVAELCTLSGSGAHVSAIKALLAALADFASKECADPTTINRLLTSAVRVLPVKNVNGVLEVRSVMNESWMISDRTMLHKIFHGKVAMLDLTMTEVKTHLALLKKMRLGDRLLSDHVKETTEIAGEVSHQPAFTGVLRAKARFIAPLVHVLNRNTAFDRLSALEVKSADRLVLRRHVKVSSKTVYGHDDVGQVVVRNEKGRLVVYVSDDDVANGVLPHDPLRDKLITELEIAADQKELLLRVLICLNDANIVDMLEGAGFMTHEPTLTIPHGETNVGDDDAENGFQPPRAKGYGEIGTPEPKPTLQGDVELPVPKSRVNQSTGTDRKPAALPDLPPWSGATEKIRPTAVRNDGRASGRVARNTSNIIDISNVQRAAESLDLGSVGVHGTSTALAPAVGSVDGRDKFSMGAMRSALEPAPSPRPAMSSSIIKNGPRTNGNYAVMPSASQADEYQLAIGSAGERFILEWLTKHFDAPTDCWTSETRAEYDLSAFDEFEGLYSDFTLVDRGSCDRFTTWLVATGFTNAAKWAGQDITYHIEVKATIGQCDEPFSLSNNQYEMAVRWHMSESDVYLIMRVYDLGTSPNLQTYVDPYGLMIAGELSFTAQGGYYVQPC